MRFNIACSFDYERSTPSFLYPIDTSTAQNPILLDGVKSAAQYQP